MGNLSKQFSRTCNKCYGKKPSDRFELMRSGYVRPMCKDCYNARKRELQGGAIRDAEKRLAQLKKIIIRIDGCTLLDNYRSEEGEYRIVLGYKGFKWDIRKSSFITGMRPWVKYKNSDLIEGYYVYQFVNTLEEIIYVGKSSKLAQRMSKHFSPSEVKRYNQPWKNDVTKVLVYKCKTEADMHFLEMYIINKIKPSYNMKGHADDDLTYDIKLPKFKEMWIGAVYDRPIIKTL